ncbi:MAG: Spx/MgsR family RNA polymerase-binding regulatory protein [Planctomycetota bacterium]|jgi:arsenate reductase
MSTIIYEYAGCGTCRKARRFLTEQAIAHELRPIRDTPPSRAELERMLAAYDGEVRRLFNTSGQDYRAGGYKDRLPTMSAAEAVAELAANGNLIKRPFVISDRGCVVGFKEAEWQALFA